MSSSSSASYGLLQTLFDTDSQSLLHNQSTSMNTNGFLPKPSSTINRLPLTNNALLWNSTPSTTTSPSLTINHNLIHHIHSSAAKKQQQREEGKDLATVVKKASNEPAFKRQRIETPSPLPTFKVRKEKLGDRVTALQQLVSPFGKTDTASVLHEAIEYIKFLHDQVNALSTPYLKYGSPPVQRQKGDKGKDEEGVTKDLKGRGLCLVPISSTFPVAAETTTDFWTPSFAGSFS
ncbi:basic helix-loop-helix DNA-binding superfamily protein [Perilla frutescens var. hirtella]|nr:basic helix-loop-helix DNA-binding superfamily protein [Perilla frutescens var. frutescens]KAH6792834.1 basic helix-loop-helix DNA-binding superfamily protein [Perilla frutescens var. hirtella]